MPSIEEALYKIEKRLEVIEVKLGITPSRDQRNFRPIIGGEAHTMMKAKEEKEGNK